MSMKKDLLLLAGSVLAMVGVAIGAVMGVLTLNGFKNTSLNTVDANNVSLLNGTIDDFISGIVVIGTFMEILMLVLVATIIRRLAESTQE